MIIYLFLVLIFLIKVLQNELSTDFEEATVEWVDCPDLTEEPFNLAAPGKRFNVSLQYSS